ncbi:MAG: hypothetical protein M9949_14825 [Candidatus Kapabacteria bacterium]|nr:hypothetical protein [Candidatus Kapabacteria bacterium]
MKKSMFFCAVMLAVLMVSCKQEQATQATSFDKYTIADDKNWVEVTDTMSIDIDCLDGDKMNDLKQFIFRNQAEYSTLDTLRVDEIFKNCVSYENPEVDFENYSLIGLLTRTGFCEIKLNVYRNDAVKKIYYVVDITNTGTEEILITNYNMLRVPPIQSDYTIVMDTIMRYRYQ